MVIPGLYTCPKCGRELKVTRTDHLEFYDFDHSNVYSASTFNKDEASRDIPTCSCGRNADICYKMIRQGSQPTNDHTGTESTGRQDK